MEHYEGILHTSRVDAHTNQKLKCKQMHNYTALTYRFRYFALHHLSYGITSGGTLPSAIAKSLLQKSPVFISIFFAKET